MKFEKPSYLREIESMTKLPVRSVQLALADLSKKKILTRRKKQHHVFYQFNFEHPDAELFSKIFHLITQDEIEKRSRAYSKIAPELLRWNDELVDTIHKARKI